jgi:hypothetical protein
VRQKYRGEVSMQFWGGRGVIFRVLVTITEETELRVWRLGYKRWYIVVGFIFRDNARLLSVVIYES